MCTAQHLDVAFGHLLGQEAGSHLTDCTCRSALDGPGPLGCRAALGSLCLKPESVCPVVTGPGAGQQWLSTCTPGAFVFTPCHFGVAQLPLIGAGPHGSSTSPGDPLKVLSLIAVVHLLHHSRQPAALTPACTHPLPDLVLRPWSGTSLCIHGGAAPDGACGGGIFSWRLVEQGGRQVWHCWRAGVSLP